MQENYVVIKKTTYLLTYLKESIKIEKLVSQEKATLSLIEEKYFQDIFKRRNDFSYKSLKLDEILKVNPDLQEIDYAPFLLAWLENVIPAYARENFYKNLQTLKFQKVDSFEAGRTVAEYNIKENLIRLNLNDPKFTNQNEFLQTLLHELIHMASSKYDEERQVYVSGFDEIGEDYQKWNRGLTEGLTENLSMIGVPNTNQAYSGYGIETLLIDQIALLIGTDKLLESFFLNLGTTKLEEEFHKLGYEQEKAFVMFRDIELNYCFRNDAEQTNLLTNVELDLLDYFNKKCQDMYLNYESTEQLQELLDTYEKVLITPEKLAFIKKNPDKYAGIEVVEQKFKEIKSMYEDLIKKENQQLKQVDYEKERNLIVNQFQQEQDSNSFLAVNFTIQEGAKPTCLYELRQMNEEGSTVLASGMYDYDENFQKNMLEPILVGFAQSSKVMEQKQMAEEEKANIQVLFENNRVVNIQNITPEYATYLAEGLNSIQPTNSQEEEYRATKGFSSWAFLVIVTFIISIIIALSLFYLIV